MDFFFLPVHPVVGPSPTGTEPGGAMGVNSVLIRNIDGVGSRLWEHVCEDQREVR